MKPTTTKKIEPLRLELEHDGPLAVAVGRSRKEMHWKNTTMQWSELLQRLRTPTRTQELHEEFMHMPKGDQDNIKDVGGFVGGSLSEGRRKSDTVLSRSMITLDVDFAGPDLLEDVKMGLLPFSGAWCVYSTHKHADDKPRLRIVLPLRHEVTPDQSEAIARRLAGDIDIEIFDDTTFQPSRLMYWPSTSRDGDYVFEYNDEDFLDPDEVLAKYPDWTDSSFWPTSSRVADRLQHAAKKQGDPTEKEGLIGAFCRTYTVPEVIEKYLAEVYVPCSSPDRYTYARGSTAAGLVIYENGLFAYSNHGTDPISGQLCNAFDLVRIHLFGSQDEDYTGNSPTARPSYKAMIRLVQKDGPTARTIASEKKAAVSADFPDDEGDGEAWKELLELTRAGAIKSSLVNLAVILMNDQALQGIAYDQLADMIAVREEVPWKREAPYWRDADDAALELYLADKYTEFPKQKLTSAVTAVADSRAFHPVREFLAGLPEWDGVERLDTLLVDYLGAEDSDYTRAVTRKTLVAAVKRVMRPGCKYDTMLVLCGPQGIGKSMLASRLGGPWFSDSLNFADMRDKTAAEKLQGNWIIEIGELNGLNRAGVAAVRQFITSQDDKYRAAFGRRVTSHPRQSIMIGTTNAEEGYLSDTAGGRRFWPVNVGGPRICGPWDLTDIEIRQIWAEAKKRYSDGEELILTGEAAKAAEQAQLDALKSDEREGIVLEYLERKLPEDWAEKDMYDRRDWLGSSEEGTVTRTQVCCMEIWCECFGNDKRGLEMKYSREITAMLKKLGWQYEDRRQRIPIYGLQRMFTNPAKPRNLSQAWSVTN